MKVVSPLFAVAVAAAVFAPSADATGTTTCSANCEDDNTSCSPAQTINAGADQKLEITTTNADTCTAGKRYLKSLKISEATGLGITVTFSHGSTPVDIPATPVLTKQDSGTTPANNCYFTYADVGLATTLTTDVKATVKCASATGGCTVKYKAEFDCKPCATLCSDDSCLDKTVPLAAPTKLDLTTEWKCPPYTNSYLKSLVVGTKYATDKVAVALGSAAQSVIAGSVDQCYSKFGNLPTDPSTLTSDVTATVTCPGATADCAVKVKPDWGCTTPTCKACATNACTAGSLGPAATTTVDLTGTGQTCTAPAKKYLKSLDVRGKLDKNVVVTFNDGLTPVPASNGTNCYYYTNVAGIKTGALDVTASIKCADVPAGCTFEYKDVWGCFTPAAGVTYTRTGAPTGTGCAKDLSDCANRCAKSYLVGTLDTDQTFIPQITAGCTCPSPSATVGTPANDGPVAANTDTTMDVKFNTAANTMTVAYTAAGKACTSTYTKAAFANKFVAKTYSRISVTPTPSTAKCEPAANADTTTQCAYKCAAQFALTKPAAATDTITTTPTAVAGCTCAAMTSVVEGDGLKASVGNAALKYDFAYTADPEKLELTTTTTSADATPVVTACKAVYKESCEKLCTDAGCTSVTVDATNGLTLEKPGGCPKWSAMFLNSLAVGSLVKSDTITVKVGANEPANPVTGGTSASCMASYGANGAAATTTTDVKPKITCSGDCTAIKVNADWGCANPVCPTTACTDCTPATLAAAATEAFDVKRETATCESGYFAYLKTLALYGKNAKDFVVTFNNGLKPTPESRGASCAYYTDVIKLTPDGNDVVASIKCANVAEGCVVDYKAEWGCYKPPVATETYTRTALAGADCVTDPADCATRCAKSYMLGMLGTDQMFVPQFTPADCKCPPVTAKPGTAVAAGPVAANDVTKMNVKFTTATNTMTIDYTGKTCTATYSKAAFVNKFATKTYTRSSVTPDSCKAAETDSEALQCAYKCTAEVTLSKPVADAINATQTAVSAACPCNSITAVVSDDGKKAIGVTKDSTTYEFTYTSDTAMTLKTTPKSGTACTAVYAEKVITPAPTPSPTPSTTAATPPATTVKTGTSAGVAATGADAGMVTVALMAAAAGAHAGMPVV